MAKTLGTLRHYIDGGWVPSRSEEVRPVYDPGSGEVIAVVPFATRKETDAAVEAASRTFDRWSRLPITERVRYLFRMKEALERHFEELATINTLNHGKTLEESRGDLKRAIENVDAAIAAAYALSKGEALQEISPGIDEYSYREPLGVFAVITPFNFPIMIPFWFIPYAVVLGNTVVLKPSEITPAPMNRVMEIFHEEVRLPPGVVNLVHGGREVAEELVRHRETAGVAFVGSTNAAKNIYRLAGEHGKRCIAQGGAKNFIVVMPDADQKVAVPASIGSFFGNCGQRCLAGSNLVVVESDQGREFVRSFVRAASSLRIGHGLSPSTEMGPMVTEAARQRVRSYVEKGIDEGARLVLDGREISVEEFPNGFYFGPTVFVDVSPEMTIAKEEIFGPVASVISASNLDEAIEMINSKTNYGNMACIFTQSGRHAREFARRVNVGNVGINIGVAAPAAYFPFAGRRESFFGVLHGQIDSVDFFTDKKVVISRW
jgi:malonate-semialdehyde dehydrogenase (acetylating)/methylmalonate-semialdehyde dehydrogenase